MPAPSSTVLAETLPQSVVVPDGTATVKWFVWKCPSNQSGYKVFLTSPFNEFQTTRLVVTVFSATGTVVAQQYDPTSSGTGEAYLGFQATAGNNYYFALTRYAPTVGSGWSVTGASFFFQGITVKLIEGYYRSGVEFLYGPNGTNYPTYTPLRSSLGALGEYTATSTGTFTRTGNGRALSPNVTPTCVPLVLSASWTGTNYPSYTDTFESKISGSGSATNQNNTQVVGIVNSGSGNCFDVSNDGAKTNFYWGVRVTRRTGGFTASGDDRHYTYVVLRIKNSALVLQIYESFVFVFGSYRYGTGSGITLLDSTIAVDNSFLGLTEARFSLVATVNGEVEVRINDQLIGSGGTQLVNLGFSSSFVLGVDYYVPPSNFLHYVSLSDTLGYAAAATGNSFQQFWRDFKFTEESTTNALNKLSAFTYVPGKSATVAVPGMPEIPRRTIYGKEEVCSYIDPSTGKYEDIRSQNPTTLAVTGSLVFVPDPKLITDVGKGFAQVPVFACRTVGVYIETPRIRATKPIPAQPAVPSQTIVDNRIGWNAGGRSGKFIYADGYGQFSVPASVSGVVVGLAPTTGVVDVVPAQIYYSFYFNEGRAYIRANGVQIYFVGSYARTDVWRIERLGNVIKFYSVSGTFGNQLLTTTAAIPGPMSLQTVMYMARDSVTSPSLVGTTSTDSGSSSGGSGLSADGSGMVLRPLTLLGGAAATALNGFAQLSMLPLTVLISARDVVSVKLSLLPLNGVGSDYVTSGGNFSFQPFELSGVSYLFETPSYAVGYFELVLPSMYGSCLTGEIATATAAKIDVVYSAVGANYAYGFGRGIMDTALTLSANSLEGENNASLGAIASAQSSLIGDIYLFVVMDSQGVVTSVITADVLWDADATSTATALTTALGDYFYDVLFVSYINAQTPDRQPQAASEVWAINLDSAATTRYENFSFNSFAQIGAKHYGAKYDGIYELDGDTDSGDSIAASVNLGRRDMDAQQLKRLDAAYIAVSSTGTMYLRVTDHDGKMYTYSTRRSSTKIEQQRIDVGRGLRANFMTFEVVGIGADFEIAGLEFMAVALDRRIR